MRVMINDNGDILARYEGAPPTIDNVQMHGGSLESCDGADTKPSFPKADLPPVSVPEDENLLSTYFRTLQATHAKKKTLETEALAAQKQISANIAKIELASEMIAQYTKLIKSLKEKNSAKRAYAAQLDGDIAQLDNQAKAIVRVIHTD